VGELAERSTSWTPDAERGAASGDRVTIDFLGKIGEEEFEGGKAEDAQLVLGQGNFIPGFEDGLLGAKAGEQRSVPATFPEDYPVAALAGKAATFAVTVKEVATPSRPELDDAFAKQFGTETFAKLKEAVAAQIGQEYAAASRLKLKRELLDQLEKAHDFELPPSLVESEFEAIWSQLNNSLQQAGKTLADEGKSEDEARAEYRRIAERRVRLGLVVGEIGEKNDVKISQDELRRALIEQARRFPGHEKAVYEYYEKTPGALAELRAPIFEDKVVDLVLEQVKPAQKKVPKEELFSKAEAATEA
jgi:trigger factor